MKKQKTLILFDNYSTEFNEYKQMLIDSGFENPSDEEVFEYINDCERLDWEEMIERVDKIFDGDDVVVIGSFGFWNKDADGGKVMKGDMQNILAQVGKDCDYFEVGINEANNLFIRCSHHDGTNYVEIKKLTIAGGYAWQDFQYGERFENLDEQQMHDKLFCSKHYTSKITRSKMLAV